MKPGPGGSPDSYAAFCDPCGKQSFTSRKVARRVRKRIRIDPGRGALNAYQCPNGSGYWHLGHLPPIDRARDVLRAQREAS